MSDIALSVETRDRTVRALTRVDWQCAAFLIGVVAFQLLLYWTYPAVPSHHPTRGWEGWWDQGQYLKSARALAAFDLSEAKHWYPIGYSLLAVPFVPIMDDPFLVPNLVCVIVFAWMFQRYFRPLIGIGGVAAAFFGALALPVITQTPAEVKHLLWLQFVIPWNTVPIAALFMSLLCLVRDLRTDDGVSKDFLIGALVGAVAAIKPVELLALTALGVSFLAFTARNRTTAARRIGMAALGVFAAGGPVLALNTYIHHGLTSPYTAIVSNIGMSVSDLPMRAIDIFVDAGPSFGEPNTALMGLLPWFPILVPLALVGAILRPRELLAPVAVVSACFLTYLAYNDFTPLSVLRYFLIHYFVWTFPVLAACGLYMAVCALRQRRWRKYCGVAIILGCIVGALRIDLKSAAVSHIESRASEGGQAFKLEFASATHIDAIDLPADEALNQLDIWDNPLKIEVDGEPLKTFSGYRLVQIRNRWRVIFKRPVDATHVSFWLPGVSATPASNVRPIRFSLRLGSSPWARHSANPDVIAN